MQNMLKLFLFSIVSYQTTQISALDQQALLRNRRDLNFKGYAEQSNKFLFDNELNFQNSAIEPITPDPGITVRPINEPNAESKLIESLLSNYNSMARPVANFNDKVNVNFTVALNQILDLDIKNQHLITALWITMEWYDTHFKWNPEEWGGVTDIRLPIKKLWRPDILLYNSISDRFDTSFPSNAVIYGKGVKIKKYQKPKSIKNQKN